MLWVLLMVLVAVTLAPFVWSSGRMVIRGRQEAAVALHRAQLVELDRDLSEGRIMPTEHATAVLEVQRRLLAAAQTQDELPSTNAARVPLVIAAIAIPVAAVALYLPSAAPEMPSEPMANREETMQMQEDALINQLETRIASLDPKSDMARQGFVLLGNVQWQRGDTADATAAWQKALDAKFDPDLAAQTAEAMTRQAGHVTEDAANLFRQALAQAPQDAPWRSIAQQRLDGNIARPP
jgi:cytochrome c-type biogenesis protein CcmH